MTDKLDLVGNIINIGDTVVFGSAQSMRLLTGEIIKINNKTVQIKHEEYSNHTYSKISESRRNFDDVVVVGRKS